MCLIVLNGSKCFLFSLNQVKKVLILQWNDENTEILFDTLRKLFCHGIAEPLTSIDCPSDECARDQHCLIRKSEYIYSCRNLPSFETKKQGGSINGQLGSRSILEPKKFSKRSMPHPELGAPQQFC